MLVLYSGNFIIQEGRLMKKFQVHTVLLALLLGSLAPAAEASPRQEIISLLKNNMMTISNIRLEKYAGRVLARAETLDGVDIGRHMIKKGLARPYHGKTRQPWCG
jgi:hypothetical protein